MKIDDSDEAVRALLAREPEAPAGRRDVFEAYRVFLRREPASAEIDGWTHAAEAGGWPRRALFERFLASEEYADRRARDEARDRAREAGGAGAIDWFHSIGLPDGTVTPGVRTLASMEREAEAIFDRPLDGLSVLDIGAWDGFFSFEAERRGAADVLATDHFCWSGPGWGTKAGFDYIHHALGSRVRSKDVDLFGLDPAVDGTFDVVLFLGVLYHLKDPYGGLERAAAMASDTLVVRTHTACNRFEEPVLRHFEGDEMADDPTNFFAPNVPCLRSMLREMGFRDIMVRPHPMDVAGGADAPLPEPVPETGADLPDRIRVLVHARR